VSITLLPASARQATRWRNGGGITREVSAAPAGASLADFDWRISMADISLPGPFSTFPGIDRILTVITGTLTLAIENQPPKMLSPSTNPVAFPGEAPCLGTPLNGPATDLNVMVRRERYAASLRRITGETIRINANVCVLVALTRSSATLAAHSYELDQLDALLVEDREAMMLTVHGAGYLVDIKAR
jgi:environmental stress-induced protein Ves